MSGNDSLVLSYLTLRKAIGILGVALPFVVALVALYLFGNDIQRSLSAYYYTGARDLFVGILCAIGVFLLSYKGYERKDDIAGDLACLFAIGVALLPTKPAVNASELDALVGALHLASAALLFLILAYFCLVLFVKSDPAIPKTPRKKVRNVIYRVCGVLILVCIGLIAFIKSPLGDDLHKEWQALQPVFWLEAIAVVAFGISWLTKGEAILSDR